MFNRKKQSLLFFRSVKEESLFSNIYGCDDINKLLRMALESDHTCSVLLTGPPASAKTLFLQSLMELKDSHFIDCSVATKSGIIDYIFENKPKYLLLDELNKLSRIDQTFLLNLIETGIDSETMYYKTRKAKLKTSVFATSNNIEKIIIPLQSRFFIVNTRAYTYEQFYEITLRLLSSNRYKKHEEIVMATVKAVWNTSRNLRDVIGIVKMAKSIGDVDWLATTFLSSNVRY